MKKCYAVLAAALLGAGMGSAIAQGVEPTFRVPQPAQAAGQQAATNLGPISMGETGVPVREAVPPAPPVIVAPPPAPMPPPPPAYVPPPPPPPAPPPPPPLAPRPDRN